MGEIRIALGFLAITFLAGITSAQSLSANAPVNLTTGKSASIQKGGAQGGIQQNADSLSTIKAMLGQKIILDFRYFCEDDTPSSQCRTPMTKIPASLLALLSSHNIGGVILFSENIENTEHLLPLPSDNTPFPVQNINPIILSTIITKGTNIKRALVAGSVVWFTST